MANYGAQQLLSETLKVNSSINDVVDEHIAASLAKNEEKRIAAETRGFGLLTGIQQYLSCVSDYLEDFLDDKITKESLQKRGWKDVNEFGDLETYYEKTVEVGDQIFNLTLRPYSNSKGRDWFVHVDNQVFESVASLDVSAFSQIDTLLMLLR